ncbi:DUF6624 domain-containing protein [Streptomyces cyaneofuscatus]|uniref:DUF6624 domain-containing protein n=1 Tax=Streptomyces cyaneofuscatus TaxID=66883 RepID=UPI0036630370
MSAVPDLNPRSDSAVNPPDWSTVTPQPQLPHLQRELLARVTSALPRWERLSRQQLSDQEIGHGRHADHANGTFLRRIVGEYGWPVAGLVGEDGAAAAFQFALHADTYVIVQQLSARAMYQAVQAGTASIRQWAHLHDRCLRRAGMPQLFGTQYAMSADGPVREPVREPAALDERRADVGLPSAAEALAHLRQRLSGPPPSAREDPPTVNLVAAA